MSKEEFEKIVNENQISAVDREILRKLYDQNNDVLMTINLKILSERFTNNLSFEEISRIVCDPKFQEALTNLDDSKCNLFFKLKESFLTERNWITGCNLIVKLLNERAYSELSDVVEQSGDKDILRNYFSFINQDKNYFEITSYEQLKNFEKIRESVCNQILSNPEEVEGLSSYLEYMSSLDRLKFATIEKNFGVSLSQAKLLCQKYAFNIENAQEIVGNEKVHEMLKKLSQIISSESMEQISKIDLSNIEIGHFIDLDAEMRESFAQMYNQSFYEPKSDDVVEVVEIENKKVTIYNPGTKFNLCAHVVGFIANANKEEFNYQETWNSPTRANHVICTRMVSNECLETADENCICYGFTNFEESSLISSAPWNMNTIQETSEFDTIGEMDEGRLMHVSQGAGSRFLTPMEQANNTGSDRNETNWDRFDKNGNRKQPSYIIYIAESLSKDSYRTNPLYQQSLLVASQYGISLVLVDRESVIENEYTEIENMIKEYEETLNPNLINRIIQKFENNRTTGSRQSFENTYKTQFPTKRNNQYLSLEEMIERLIDISKENENPVQQYQQMINELLAQTIRNVDDQIDLCDIIYRISELDPSLTVDMNRALKQKIGITQKTVKPREISQSYMGAFYNKRKLAMNMAKSEQFSSQLIENGLCEIASEAKMSNFNETSQNIRNDVEKAASQELENERMGYG